MKKIISCNLIFALLASQLFGQTEEKIIGIYKTSEDFTNNKLYLVVDCNSKTNVIRLNDVLNKKYITVKDNGTSYRVYKNSLYGYKTCNGKIYRFLNKKELLLINPGEEILVYKYLLAKPMTAGKTNVTNCYFSIAKDKDLQKLTIRNLKNSFPENMKFQQLIDEHFKYNTDLMAIDDYTKMYEVNYLLKQTESHENGIP